MENENEYDDSVNYKVLLRKYLKWVFQNWISRPDVQKKHPRWVGHKLQVKFVVNETCAGPLMVLDGDMFCSGVNVEKTRNLTYFKLLETVMRYGVHVVINLPEDVVWDTERDTIWAYPIMSIKQMMGMLK